MHMKRERERDTESSCSGAYTHTNTLYIPSTIIVEYDFMQQGNLQNRDICEFNIICKISNA
jgi:hypothetical protein